MTDFGLNETQWGWRVQGVMSLDRILLMVGDLIDAIGMTPDGPPNIDFYPKGGKGGAGVQIYQPLYESWLIVSTWPKYGFMRINLSSCKTYLPSTVSEYLEKHVGPIHCQGGCDL